MTLPRPHRYWSTALACLALQGLGVGLVGLYGFFVGPIGEQFHAGPTTMAMGMALMLLLTAVMSPLLGSILDRTAIRPLLLAGVVLASTSLWMMGRAATLGEFTGWFIGFLVGIICYGPLSCNVLIIRAYSIHRARALAIAAMGVSFASILLPLLVAWLLENQDWRAAMAVLAALVAAVLLPLALFAVTESGPGEAPQASLLPEQHNGMEFLRRREFWLLGVGMAILFNGMILSTAVLVPHFIELGLSRADAASIFSLGGAAGLAGKLGFAGAAAGVRNYVKHMAVVLALVQVAAWSLLANAEGYTSALAGMLLSGASAGILIAFYPYINSVYFDQRIIGRVNGAQAPLFLPLGLAAAPLAGMVFERSGSYSPALQVVVVLLLLVTLMFLVLPRVPAQQVQAL